MLVSMSVSVAVSVSITMSVTMTMGFMTVTGMSVVSVSVSVSGSSSNDLGDWSDRNNSFSNGVNGWGGLLNDSVITMDGVSSVGHSSGGTVRVEDGVLACKSFR